jgi:diaminobutyrate-2-oxoglutarate transaminase
MNDVRTSTVAQRKLGRTFLQLWLGETAFAFAAALLGFALGVWVYQQTGSAEMFSLAVVSATVPALLLLPLVGSLADHFDRRWIIATADALFMLMTLVLAALLFTGQLQVVHLFVFNCASAMITAVRTPAYKAAVSAIVPDAKLTQANGMLGLSLGAAQLVAPLVAGGLMAHARLDAIVLINLALEAGGALAVFGALARSGQILSGCVPPGRGRSVLRVAMSNLTGSILYFKRQRAMVGLLFYTVTQKGLLTLVASMMTPMVLATHSSATLGVIMTFGAAGGLGGSLLLVATNAQTRLMTWVLVLDAFLSLCVLIAGLGTSPAVWCACTFLAAFAGAASEGCAMALWMRCTPKQSQGSIFALIGTSGLLVVSLVMLSGGLLSQRVLEPAMAAGGAWEASVGSWLGSGKGRGLGLLFVVCGTVCMVISLVALVGANLRRLDDFSRDAGVAGKALQ